MNQLTNYNLIDDMYEDWQIYQLKKHYYTDSYIWQMWIKGWQ